MLPCLWLHIRGTALGVAHLPLTLQARVGTERAVSGPGLPVSEPTMCLRITLGVSKTICAQTPLQKVLIHLFWGWALASLVVSAP